MAKKREQKATAPAAKAKTKSKATPAKTKGAGLKPAIVKALDPKPKPAKTKAVAAQATPASAAPETRATTSHPYRNDDFPRTYIKTINVSLDDPNHWVTLVWTGAEAGGQETGPFRSSPGAGSKGLNCDLGPTSRRSGSHCTPKGTRTVEGFARRLNSDSRAEYVTWFHEGRGIAFHYFPSVPTYAASHGCVRLESKRVARLIQDNARIDRTSVVVGGTWTKPAKQW